MGDPKRWIGAALMLAALAAATPAHAQEATGPDPRQLDDPRRHRATWVPIGVTLGWRGDGDTNAFVVGGEVSVIFFESSDTMFHGPADPSLIVGALLDAVWVSNPSHFRATVGAEIAGAFGSSFAGGVEAGITFHSRGDIVGFRARGFFTLLFPTLYVGLDYHGRVGAEAGLLLKVPFRL